MKKIFSILTMIALIAIVIVACKDKFNESDFLTLQSKLKTQQDTAKLNQQIKELNQSGSLLSFTVQVVEDRTPLAGVDVLVSNDLSAGSVKVTTDANGNAVFPKASVGSNTITLSKTGYITATAVVDFGALAVNSYYILVTGANGAQNIVPLKQSKSVLLPMFSIGGTGSTGTIMGRVTIENDLTNTKPEVPQNITIKANFNAAIPAQVQGTGVNVMQYNFNQANFGTATVDNTTGLYSMVVPATAVGLAVSLIIPEIDGTLKVAANTVDNQPANGQPAPQVFPGAIINQATLWGPNVAGTYDGSVPNVPGAKIVFPAPPAAGAGLNLTFSALARALSVDKTGTGGNAPYNWDTFNWGANEDDPNSFDIGETSYQLTSRGAGYTSSPAITLSGGGGTGASMKASLRGIVTGIAIATGGTGYPATSGSVNLDVYFQDNGAVPTDHYLFTINNCTYTAAAGVISSIALPATGNNTLGIDSSTPWRTTNAGVPLGYNVGSGNWKVVVNGGGPTTPATATATVSGEVDHIQLEKYGSGYTGAPTIAFTGGGGSTQATLVVNEFRSQWSVALDNSGNTTNYAVPPQLIQWQVDTYNAGQHLNDAVWDNLNNQPSFSSLVKASNNKVVQIDPLLSYRTYDYTSQKPKAVITPSLSVTAQATVAINPDGTINSVNFPNSGQAGFGRGYNSLIQAQGGSVQPMFTGISGSGGAIDLTSWNCNSCFEYGEYTFPNFGGGIAGSNTAFFLTPGAGYLPNVNQQGLVNFSGNSNVSVKTGDVQVIDIKYGTGKRKNTVQ